MTVSNAIARPELFWISGSPPSWRVMLALAIKRIDYASRLLDASLSEHKAAAYLALNPRGQVPTLRDGDVIVRESVAILAYLDARWPERPIFGAGPAAAAEIWQKVMDFESNLRPVLTTVAQAIFRNQISERAAELSTATETASAEFDRLQDELRRRTFLVGDSPTAADCVLYPGISWLARAIDKSSADGALPAATRTLLDNRPVFDAWRDRIETLPGFSSTYPPHWRSRN
tara:strand:+ start:464 stop:1156 length:693 start_codon:yes stop_codon:yes gene_type:complete